MDVKLLKKYEAYLNKSYYKYFFWFEGYKWTFNYHLNLSNLMYVCYAKFRNAKDQYFNIDLR